MTRQQAARYTWLCIPLFAVGAWLGTVVAESSFASRDLHAYIILNQSTQIRNCVELKAKADEALLYADDPELKTFAGMISDAMKLLIEADVTNVEDGHSLPGVAKCVVAVILDRKLSLKAALLLAKKAWYYDLGQKLDTHYQRFRVLANFTGGLVGGLVALAMCFVVRFFFVSGSRPGGETKPQESELIATAESRPIAEAPNLERF